MCRATPPGTSAGRRTCSSVRAIAPTCSPSCVSCPPGVPLCGSASAATCWCAMAASAASSSARTAPSRRLERVNDTTVHCEAGVPCARIARQCIKWGLGPAEFFAGIPGTLGGALAMNAGAFGGETWRHVASVETSSTRSGTARTRERQRVPGRLSPRRRRRRRTNGSSRARWSSSTRPGVNASEVRELLAQPQGHAADRRVELRLGVHQSPGRSRRAADRGGGAQGLSHRRCLGVAQAREFHHQPRAGARGGRRKTSSDTCSATVERRARRRARARSAHRRGVPTDAPAARPQGPAPRHRAGASSAASRCCFGGTSSEREISLTQRQCRARGAAAAAASMRTPSIRATSRSPHCSSEGFDARLHRAARSGRRGRHAAGRAGVPGHPLHRQRRHGLGHRHGQAAHQAAGAGGRRCRPPSTWCCAGPQDLRGGARAARLPHDREARDAGLERRHDQGREGRGPAGRLRGRRAARAGRVRRALDHRRANTRSRSCRARRCPRSASRRRRPSTTTRRSTSATTRKYFCPSGLSASAEAAPGAAWRSPRSRPPGPTAGGARIS